jgi:predicted NBD/HSP70 family sugar kinase
VLACVEIGGSSVETVLFAPDGTVVRVEGPLRPAGARLAIASPGLIDGCRVAAASSLGWFDVDPAEVLGIGPSAELVLNDAEAAALGEVVLRGDHAREALYVCVGTGVGAAVVRDGAVVAANLLGHSDAHTGADCLCGKVGCVETVAAGWALPQPIPVDAQATAPSARADPKRPEPHATPQLVVLAGGLVQRYPELCARIAAALPDRAVEASAAPDGFKSAAAWGLRHAVAQVPVTR